VVIFIDHSRDDAFSADRSQVGHDSRDVHGFRLAVTSPAVAPNPPGSEEGRRSGGDGLGERGDLGHLLPHGGVETAGQCQEAGLAPMQGS
jgi:hypothetical protein